MANIGGVVDKALPPFVHPVRRLSNGFAVMELSWQDDEEKTQDWADEQAAVYGGRQSPWWQQNMERVVTRGGQAVWPMLDRQVHIRPFTAVERASGKWAVWRSLDHGVRHPTCCAWVAVAEDEYGQRDYIFFRQYYQTDATVRMNARAILERTPPDEHVFGTVADPSLWQRDPRSLEVWAEVYGKEGLPLVPADNALDVGVEKVTEGLVASLARWAIFKNDLAYLRAALKAPNLSRGWAERLASGPAVWFTPETAAGRMSLFEQCRNWRFLDWTGKSLDRAPPQQYIDLEDEGPDVVRYAMQTGCVRFSRQPVPQRPMDALDRIIARRKEPALSRFE